MKKLKVILFAVVVLFCFTSCSVDFQDPLRYKGCVVINKDTTPPTMLHLKLTSEMRDSLHRDYWWVLVPEYEMKQYEIGDTIK